MKKCECVKCGRLVSKSNIEKHTIACTGIIKKSYKVQHDGLNCLYCNKLCKNKNSLCQHEIRCRYNPDRLTVYVKNFNSIGHKAWNKGLTKKTDTRVKKYADSHVQSLKSGTTKILFGEQNPSKREDVRNKISNTCLQKSKLGQWHNSLAAKKRVLYNGIWLDSTWEAAYAKYLDNNNIKWIRPVDKFQYLFNDKVHYYTPDFYLLDSDEFVEIKGYKRQRDQDKWKQFPPDKKLTILMFKDLIKLGIQL